MILALFIVQVAIRLVLNLGAVVYYWPERSLTLDAVFDPEDLLRNAVLALLGCVLVLVALYVQRNKRPDKPDK